MPGFNGTGPMGAGPMTGGGRGFVTLPEQETGGPMTGVTVMDVAMVEAEVSEGVLAPGMARAGGMG